MPVNHSFELFTKLINLGLLKHAPKYWWPSYGTFEVVLGAILTQNSRFEKVEHSLENLRRFNYDHLESWQDTDALTIMPLIEPSGLYRQKSTRLIMLAEAIKEAFGNFETFAKEVDRSWLLSQKGIGLESADAILCYACKRDVMVVDSYTARLLSALDFVFEDYEEIQQWLTEGIETHADALTDLYGRAVDLNEVYAHFHGAIVEYCKVYVKGKKVDISALI